MMAATHSATLTKPPRAPTSRGPVRPVVRCAVYTRKSTEEGLEQEFNSLDAQRESGEAYIRSQQSEGWTLVPDRYDDGGFTGGNLDRPALKRLLADIEAGKIDIVIVYKVDRLSRSLLDFTRLVEIFDQHHVQFVSVTQLINTANSMGRLMLNVLLSFAQFEREIISERTRDKIAAARRKGKWSGGMPILGYDVDPNGSKLVVHAVEAEQVRAIFSLYLEHQSLITVIGLLDQRGWTNKRWTTRKGAVRGGKPFTKSSLHKLLTNVTYVGQIRYKDEIHEGEQEAIVAPVVWQQTQSQLQRNGRAGGEARSEFTAILKGILRCAACDCAMSPSHTTRGNRRYRYYVCHQAQQRGWKTCPSPSLPAGEIERFVVDQIRAVGRDPALVRATIAAVAAQTVAERTALETEQRATERELGRWNRAVRELIEQLPTGDEPTVATDRLADLQERIRAGEQRLAEIRDRIQELAANAVTPDEVTTSLAQFDPLWDVMTPREQVRMVSLLVARVDYDGRSERVAVTFHPHGRQTLSQETNR